MTWGALIFPGKTDSKHWIRVDFLLIFFEFSTMLRTSPPVLCSGLLLVLWSGTTPGSLAELRESNPDWLYYQ